MNQNTVDYDKSQIINTIKNYLNQYNKINGMQNKILLTKYFVDYLITAKQFIIDNPTFKISVLNKMNQLKIEINDLIIDPISNESCNSELYPKTISNINYLIQMIDDK